MIWEQHDVSSRKLLVHWRGEKDAGYSKPFRHLEFQGAIEAELDLPCSFSTTFTNALDYTGEEFMPEVNIEHFNEAMQYVSFSHDKNGTEQSITVSRGSVIRTAQRCSLIHALYEVIASSDNLDDLADLALESGGFEDLYKGSGENENSTWCFRARNYGELPENENVDLGRVKRYSSRARSMGMEKQGLKALTNLLIRFGGKVDLQNPQVKIYIFDGLSEGGNPRKILARQIATGPKTSSISPAERICITNTPLEPIAAFSLCNVARIRNRDKILDPYAGSCATLLAAAMIAPSAETVGIEIAHNGLVNRDDIIQDFRSRSLKPPKLICGDSTKLCIREEATKSVGGVPFDACVADPPYGIRESTNYNENSPLEELFTSIAFDREASLANPSNHSRLLRLGGRLVAFVPVTDQQTLSEMLPNQDLKERAGLQFEVSREQPLNEKLSRWLVSYLSVR